jgi:hypothetical protein
MNQRGVQASASTHLNAARQDKTMDEIDPMSFYITVKSRYQLLYVYFSV